MTDDELAAAFGRAIEAALLAAIAGPPAPPRRPTALRLRGGMIESVELDEAGNVIEPARCTCGRAILLHAPSCPFYCLTT